MSTLRDKLSLRMLALVCLVVLFALLAVVIGKQPWHIAALLVPGAIVGALASIRRMLSPYMVTAVGIVAYLAIVASINLSVGIHWTPVLAVLTVIHVSVMVVMGLVLSEIQLLATAARTEEDAIIAQERVISLSRLQGEVAKEMRRSRRTGRPMALVLLRKSDGQRDHSRADLVSALIRETREFDQLFSLSRSELGVICFDTDKRSAARFASRLSPNLGLEEIAIVSFPEDAVTSSGLIDALTRTEQTEREPALEAVLD